MSRESIRARVAAATPGPWKHYHAPKLRKGFGGPPVNEVQTQGGDPVVQWGGFDGAAGTRQEKRADAAFIAAARQDIPALLAVADAAADFIDGCNHCRAFVDGFCPDHETTGAALDAPP